VQLAALEGDLLALGGHYDFVERHCVVGTPSKMDLWYAS
jgi:hypothetical protein